MLLSLVWSSKFLQVVFWAVSSHMPQCCCPRCDTNSPRRVASGQQSALTGNNCAHLLSVILEEPEGSSHGSLP